MNSHKDRGKDPNEREPAPGYSPMQIAGKVVRVALIVLALLIVISVMSRM
jgi:hypothetical protein